MKSELRQYQVWLAPAQKLQKALTTAFRERRWAHAVSIVQKASVPSDGGIVYVEAYQVGLMHRAGAEKHEICPIMDSFLSRTLKISSFLGQVVGDDSTLIAPFRNELENLMEAVQICMDVLIERGRSFELALICDNLGPAVLRESEVLRDNYYAALGYVLAHCMAHEKIQHAEIEWSQLTVLDKMASISRANQIKGLPFLTRASEKLKAAFCHLLRSGLDPSSKADWIKGHTLLDDLSKEWNCFRDVPERDAHVEQRKRLWIAGFHWTLLFSWVLRHTSVNLKKEGQVTQWMNELTTLFKNLNTDLERSVLTHEVVNKWKVDLVELIIQSYPSIPQAEKTMFAFSILDGLLTPQVHRYEAWALYASMRLSGKLIAGFDKSADVVQRHKLIWNGLLDSKSITVPTRLGAMTAYISEIDENTLATDVSTDLANTIIRAPLISDGAKWCLLFSDIRGLITSLHPRDKHTKTLQGLRASFLRYLAATPPVLPDASAASDTFGVFAKWVALARAVVLIDSYTHNKTHGLDEGVKKPMLELAAQFKETLATQDVKDSRQWLRKRVFHIFEPFIMLVVEATLFEGDCHDKFDSAVIYAQEWLHQIVVTEFQCRLRLAPEMYVPSVALLISLFELYLGRIDEYHKWRDILQVKCIQKDSLQWVIHAPLLRWFEHSILPPKACDETETLEAIHASSTFKSFGICAFYQFLCFVKAYVDHLDRPRPESKVLPLIDKDQADKLADYVKTLKGQFEYGTLDDFSVFLGNVHSTEPNQFDFKFHQRDEQRKSHIDRSLKTLGLGRFISSFVSLPNYSGCMSVKEAVELLESGRRLPPSLFRRCLESLLLMRLSTPGTNSLRALTERAKTALATDTVKPFIPASEDTCISQLVDPDRRLRWELSPELKRQAELIIEESC